MCQGWILRIGIDLLQSRLCGVLLRGKTRKNVEELYSWFLKTPYISIPTRKTICYNAVFTMHMYILKYLFGAFVLVVPIVDNQDYKRGIKRSVENTFIISIEKNILGWTASVIKRYYQSTYWIRNEIFDTLQMTYSNPFSWMKIVIFWLEFHWNLFPRIQLIIF